MTRKRPAAKAVWLFVNAKGNPENELGDEIETPDKFERAAAKDAGCRYLLYVPRDKSAEFRAARYERALSKILHHQKHPCEFCADEGCNTHAAIARRALARER